jgi:phosphatidylinositol glycan class N
MTHPFPLFFLFFYADASFLDEWSFERVGELLNQSNDDPEIHKHLYEDQVVIFLHLLGCDTNGHAHRPFSPIYLNNIEVVDSGVKATVELVEKLFPDQQTAYIFTADHGMSEKGISL